jgi:cold shock CspA family protein
MFLAQFIRRKYRIKEVVMEISPQISFRNIDPSPEIESRIREEISSLETYYPRIMGCRVVVDIPHKHHRFGNPYALRIDLTVPGGEISVNRAPSKYTDRKDIHDAKISKSEEIKVVHKQLNAVINEAFDTARRLLQEHIRKQRSDVKMHEVIPHATVTKLFRRKGYGLLRTSTGRQLSFQNQSVLNEDFQRLQVGTKVTYVEEQGAKGPEATLIRISGAMKKQEKT